MKGTIIITDDGRQAGSFEKALQQAGATVTSQTTSSGTRFLAFEWSGTDDELRSVIERATEVPRGEPGAIPSLDEVERRHITRVLTAAHGNKTLAARILGVDRKTLHRKLSQYARTGSSQPENGVSTLPG